MAARKRGRPTKRTAAVTRVLVAALKAGNTRRNSAILAGIGWTTLKRWCQLSEPFRATLEQAEAEAESAYVKTLLAAARKGNPQPAQWWLKVRRHDDWREPAQRVEINHRAEAEAIAAEIGKPELVDAIERDILIGIEAAR
jgi:hypothetical protein